MIPFSCHLECLEVGKITVRMDMCICWLSTFVTCSPTVVSDCYPTGPCVGDSKVADRESATTTESDEWRILQHLVNCNIRLDLQQTYRGRYVIWITAISTLNSGTFSTHLRRYCVGTAKTKPCSILLPKH